MYELCVKLVLGLTYDGDGGGGASSLARHAHNKVCLPIAACVAYCVCVD
jgi:hypothetical protein